MKIVSAREMARLEKRGLAGGASERDYMLQAGRGIADATAEFITENALEKQVLLLIGRGNNGGDAYAAGSELLARGFSVQALPLFPFQACSSLSQEQAERFARAGGKSTPFPSPFPHSGVILDGIAGTGFHGSAEGPLLEAIRTANSAGLPLLAIDIPSGVDGNTGEVGTEAILATQTLYLGLPKSGFFLGSGWEHVGELKRIDFGLDPGVVAEAVPEAELFNPLSAAALLPRVRRTQHKYQAGYLLAVAGSSSMPGAALLSSLSALRSGAGIVRLFHLCSALYPPPEVIAEPAEEKRILLESQRADALVIGPGLGRTKEAKKLIKLLLSRVALPCVLDADALFFLAEYPSWQIRGSAILTPHRGEMQRLLGGRKPTLALSQAYVEERGVTLVLKGAPNLLFRPGQLPLVIPRGDPGMATAGAGDVLSGVIGALLAQGVRRGGARGDLSGDAALLGVYLHALSGELAARARGSRSMIASDIIAHLSDAFLSL